MVVGFLSLLRVSARALFLCGVRRLSLSGSRGVLAGLFDVCTGGGAEGMFVVVESKKKWNWFGFLLVLSSVYWLCVPVVCLLLFSNSSLSSHLSLDFSSSLSLLLVYGLWYVHTSLSAAHESLYLLAATIYVTRSLYISLFHTLIQAHMHNIHTSIALHLTHSHPCPHQGAAAPTACTSAPPGGAH